MSNPITLGSMPDVLYVLTISGDLGEYYDDEHGEGAFDALTPRQQYALARAVERALDGYMEDRFVAFEYGIEAWEQEEQRGDNNE